MTTTPVHSITDEQIAEIEKAAKDKKAEGFLLTHNLSCDNLIALVARLREAEKERDLLKQAVADVWSVKSALIKSHCMDIKE